MNPKVTVTTLIGTQEVVAGHLYPAYRSGVFSYTTDYLAHPRAFALAPSLPLVAGPQAFDGLGPFSDSAPDRWGRKLLQRAAGKTSLGEYDYLLGVNDASRQGATRFWLEGVAQAADGTGVPAEVDLPQLLSTADAVEQNFTDIPDLQTRRLFRATGSLGGARPKANVKINGQLWLAKFPKPIGDDWDIMGWEFTARSLQEKVGITVPQGRTLTITDGAENPRRIYLQRRFDRTPQGARIPYISAMTALEAQDGDGGDWVDLLEFAREHGAKTGELWRRLAFGYLLGNTDDHLRNHGFLYVSGAWSLAPSFDVNPTPDEAFHQLSLYGSEDYTLHDVLHREILSLCGLTEAAARQWLRTAYSVLEGAVSEARKNGLDAHSVSVMEPRFAQSLEELRDF